MFAQTETERINRLVNAGGGTGLTELQFFALELNAWKGSELRQEQILGELYYAGQHDILDRKRTIIGKDGAIQAVENLPNNKIIDNQYAKMVDQKANYLLGKPFTVDSDNASYVALLKKMFDRRFQRTMKLIGEDALNGAVAWLYPYYDEEGDFRFRRFPPYEILPFWKDDAHTDLDCALRYYCQEVWEGLHKTIVERVEVYKKDGIYRYVLDGLTLIPDIEQGEYTTYFTVKDEKGATTGYNWNKVPLLAFKYNAKEIPLLRRLKSLQDGINTMLSDFQNGMQEDPRNTILVLKNYDGQDLGEFRSNLATFGAVKVREDGGVETLHIEVKADTYKAILEVFKKALIENARGYDAKDDRLSGNPNQMNIQSMYSDIDLDANGMETEFQAGLEALLWFIQQHFKNQGQGDFGSEEVTIVFNRDILINEAESIENCTKSVGILSNESIVGQHPWTVDVEKELKRVKNEREQSILEEYQNSFAPTGVEGEQRPNGGDG